MTYSLDQLFTMLVKAITSIGDQTSADKTQTLAGFT